MNQQLLRYNTKKKIMVFDFETEGLNLIDSRPWQVSWLVARGKDILREHDRFIWWDDLNISKRAAEMTGFDRGFYKDADHEYRVNGKVVPAEPLLDVYTDFAKDLMNIRMLILGQNILNFDVYLIAQMQRILGIPVDYSFMPRCLDTRSLAVAIQQDQKETIDHSNLLGWMYRMTNSQDRRNTKVTTKALLGIYNIEHDEDRLHDGLYDIEMCYQIFRKQIFELEI